MTSTAYQDQPRRGFVPALLAGVLLLGMGLYGGWLVFGGSRSAMGAAAPRVTGADQQVVQVPVTQGSGTVVQGSPAAASGSSGGVPGKAITVSAVVTGQLGPSSPAALLVTVTNPNNQPVVVTSVTGAVTSVSPGAQRDKAACSASWYHVAPFSGTRTVERNSSTTVALALTFDDIPATNQDNCKGARFSYSFSAQARQA